MHRRRCHLNWYHVPVFCAGLQQVGLGGAAVMVAVDEQRLRKVAKLEFAGVEKRVIGANRKAGVVDFLEGASGLQPG